MFPVNQWGGTGTPNYGLYQNPQMTSGIPIQMQGTGFPTGMLPNASFVQRPSAPPPPPPQIAAAATGSTPQMMTPMNSMRPMMGQMTGMSPMMGQPTGMSPMMGQPTGMSPMMGQPTGMPPMMAQMTGLPMTPQMTGASADPSMRLMYTQFLPAAQPYSGMPTPSNMNFNQNSLQPAQFQSKLQSLTQIQAGPAKKSLSWAMSKEERKSYDNIFRAWDSKRTGWISGDVARELFSQSGLSREQLLQIWHLADPENRGKLNIAEFHIAMALIYRALNGNEIPDELPSELIPSSTRDLSESVDFLKDLLKQDTHVRKSTALNLAEPGSNKDTKYSESRSFYKNPVEREATSRPSDAIAYKHQDTDSAGYRSRSRHLDRREVSFNGQVAAESLGEMKRQLEKTQRMLERTDLRDEEDHDLQNEMEDVQFAIRRLQDDIEYYNRKGPHAGEQRRKAERTLMQLLHERLPQLERRLERRQNLDYQRGVQESRQRDERNNDRYAHLRESATISTPSVQANPQEQDVTKKETSKNPSTLSAPAAKLSPSERDAWIRSEAQRRVQERMRMLGVGGGTVDKMPSVDVSVEQRLAAERSEAEARAAQADKEAKEREEARKARMRGNRQAPQPPPRSHTSEARQSRPMASPEPESERALDSQHKLTPEPELGQAPDTQFKSMPEPVPVPNPPREFTSQPELVSEPEPEPEPEPGPVPDPPREFTPQPGPVSAPDPEPEPEDKPQPSRPSNNPFFRSHNAESMKQQEQRPEILSKPEFVPELPVETPSAPQPTSAFPSQRYTPSTSSSRSIHLPPSNEDDWDEEEEEEENPMSSRATRQQLAQQLFSGIVPTSEPAPPAPEAPPASHYPALEPAPSTSRTSLGGGMGDRNALLSQIRGGQMLRKTVTHDRSGAQSAGAVLGSSSPPNGLSLASVPEPESSDDDEAGLVMPMHATKEMIQAPDANEPSFDSKAYQETRSANNADVDASLGFDMGRTMHFRSIYPFEGGEGMLSFSENQVFLIHPSLSGMSVEGDWTYGALLSDPAHKGLIPAAYVTDMEHGTLTFLRDILTLF